jgi:hypothetical protein
MKMRSSTSPNSFTPREMLPVPIEYEARWIPEQVWILWRKEKFLAPAGNWIPAI